MEAKAIKDIADAVGGNDLPAMFLLGNRYIEGMRKLVESSNAKMMVLPADIMAAVGGLINRKQGRCRVVMDAHTKFDIQQAFVATSQDVTKMWKTLEVSGMAVTATANCSDGFVKHFQDSEMLAQYENPQRSSITALEISGRCCEPYMTAEISLGARYSAPVSVSLRGEEAVVASMRMAFTDILDGMKPWYSRISTIDLFYVWFPIFMVLMLLFYIMSPSNAPKPAVPLTKALSILAIMVIVIGLIGAAILGVYWVRKRLFPTATFSIGQGLSRHQYYEQVRWAVIVGFVVSVVASIIAALLLTV